MPPENVKDFVTALPVKKLHGVGKVTAEKMKRLGINSCGDLHTLSDEKLTKYFGSFGSRLRELSLGIDDRPVQTERIRKSVSVENTYARDLISESACLAELPALIEQLKTRLARIDTKYAIHKQFIKIKFHDFTKTTVETLSSSTDPEKYLQLCVEGFARGNKPVRLLGVGVRVRPASLVPDDKESDQLALSLD